MDWHVRADTLVNGQRAKFSDALGKFLDSPTITFSLNSGYAVYPKSYYDGICPGNSGVDTGLAAGCAFDIFDLSGKSVLNKWPNQSFSGGSYGDMKQWGPDYRPLSLVPPTPPPEEPAPLPVPQLAAPIRPPEEMPGSDGVGVQMVYTMPGDKRLTFWNVVTRTNASLIADGTLLPFLKFNTSDGTAAGKLASVDFEWRKLSGGQWTAASATEVAMIVNDNGGHAQLYTQRSGGNEVGLSFDIPRDAVSGNIAVRTDAALSSFCNSAISYDDKLGLRLFAGSFAPDDPAKLCP